MVSSRILFLFCVCACFNGDVALRQPQQDLPIDLDYYFNRIVSTIRSNNVISGDECLTSTAMASCSDGCGQYPAVCTTEGKCLCKLSVLSNGMLVNAPQTRNVPALRHHIAHFCPNLGIARKCIRDCMKVAKPAFCGKDHVCYCGHTYTSHDKVEKPDPKALKNQFYDLYEKYFGPNVHK